MTDILSHWPSTGVQIGVIGAGSGPSNDRLKGYTSSTASARREDSIYVHDEKATKGPNTSPVVRRPAATVTESSA